MITIVKPYPISGDILASQLSIDSTLIYDDGQGNIIINAELDKKLIDAAIKSHVIPEPPKPTIQEKLAAAGIDLDDLRIALGL